MVSFQCDACCDVVKKPKLDQHRLRCQSSFTCIDCSTTFAGPHEYKGHTFCVSEAQKYEKALYKGPKQDGRENKPAEQQGHNGWGAGSRTYEESQQGPHQRNGRSNTQQRGRWQQRPMGSGGNETPLGRQSRMNFPPPEGAGALGVPKFAQQSEPRPTATTGDSTPAPPAIELYKEEEPKRQQYKDIDVMAEGNAAPKAVRSEKRQPARKRKTAEKKAQGEAEAADKPSEIPQATIAPEVRESRNTLGSAVSPSFGPSTSKKKSKKKGASDLETTKEDRGAVDASALAVTVPEPVVERKKKSRKLKEREGAIDPECSTSVDAPGAKKKRKKEQGKGNKREELTISEPTLVEATPVRADENTKPKKRKRDEDGKERDEAKAAKKARKAERKLEKVLGSAPKLAVSTKPKADPSVVLSCNVSLSYDFGTNP